MAGRKLTTQRWEAIRVHLPHGNVSPRGARLDAALKASSGCSGRVPNGMNSPAGTAAPRPAGGGSSRGMTRGYCSRSGGPSWPSSMTSKRSGGMHALPLGALCLRTRGTLSRQDEVREGYTVDGCGRWRGDLRWEQSLEAAPPAEVTPLEQPLDTVAVGRPGKPGRPRKRPQRLMADRGGALCYYTACASYSAERETTLWLHLGL
jgi:hypothetical protein